MASPQLENGYIRIATEILDHLCTIRISGEARQVLDFVIRKTYGFSKKEDRIALSQFVKGTGLKKSTICKAIKKLEVMNLIAITQKGNEIDKTYGINKDFDSWRPLPKKEANKGKVLIGRSSIRDIKNQIRGRDKNECKVCSYNGNVTGENLHIHHIDFNQGNNAEENLITLCKSCHAKSHNNDLTYQDYLISLITKKGNGKKISLPKIEINTTQNRNKSLPKKSTTIDTNTIDTTKDIVADATFSFEKELLRLKDSTRKDFKIIALYWKKKRWEFKNQEQFNAALTRELKASKNLKGYTGEEIAKSINYCMKEYPDIWTLETVFKRIQDLVNRSP
jgi:phage replication O-like protein O